MNDILQPVLVCELGCIFLQFDFDPRPSLSHICRVDLIIILPCGIPAHRFRFRLGDALVIFGGPELATEKVRALNAVRRSVRADGRRLIRVDLRAPNRPAATITAGKLVSAGIALYFQAAIGRRQHEYFAAGQSGISSGASQSRWDDGSIDSPPAALYSYSF